MANSIVRLCCLLSAFTIFANLPQISNASHDNLFCYYGSWAHYRTGNGAFKVEDLDPNLCTHLIYTFINIGADGSVIINDNWLEVDLGNLKKFTALKNQNRQLKTLIAIGGWNAASHGFTKVANDPSLRAIFVKNIINFIQTYNFDGLDVDWEYPTQNGGSPTDKEAYSEFLKDLSNAFKPKGLLLTAAVRATEGSASQSYDIPTIAKYLDFINIMAYDIHGSWDPTVGHNAPLGSGNDNDPLLVKNAVQYWINQGADRQKIILGMPLYGRSFKLQNPQSTSPGSPASGAGISGPYTSTTGMLGLNELCEKNLTEKYPEVWDESAQVPYTFKGSDWISYENRESLKRKAEFAVKNGLGGGMVWSIETDDFKNVCGFGKYYYTNVIKNSLKSNSPGPSPMPTTLGDVTSEPSTEPPLTTSQTTDTPSTSQPETIPSTEPPLTTSQTTDTPSTSQPETIPSTEPPLTTSQTTDTPSTSQPETIPTTQPSLSTAPPTDSPCKAPGVNPHPDKHKFYLCQQQSNGKYISWPMDCPPTLIFNEKILACDWPHNVKT